MSDLITRRRSFIEQRWTVDDSAELYGIGDWGSGYFATNPAGHLTVQPFQDHRAIDLHDVIAGLAERGINTPVLLRFDDVLEQHLRGLRAAFDDAIKENEYTGRYQSIYPIKVNQQRHLCEQILAINRELGFGFEAGSKPELLAVLGITARDRDMPIVCNGFKDSAFIEMVVLATKLGRNILTVVEKFSELRLLVEHSNRYGVRPRIGMRAKLSSRGAGRWESSGGLRSKFGLTVSELVAGVEYLRENDMLDCLKMVHCHLGSQVYDIRNFKAAVTELAYIYAGVRQMGASECGIIDVGGGLGVDYDGSRSASASSVNYTIEEYAGDIVYRIMNVCDDEDVPHPDIYSESGRYVVAHSSALVFNILGRSRFDDEPDIERFRQELESLPEDDQPQPIHDLLDAYESITDRNLLEAYHDAMQARDEGMSLFSLGYMSLSMRAACEQIFWAVGRRIVERAAKLEQVPDEFHELPQLLSDIYFCNFSLFQSMPDAWAIGQVFPVCPIHRLDEQPNRLAVLADITCDSDGKIDRFVDKREYKRTLELHELKRDEPYYVGAFLLGAYQEVLGDLHNLFGDTHVVHLRVDASGGWAIEEIINGDNVKEVLGYVEFDTEVLRRAMRRDVERSVRKGHLQVAESRQLMSFYESGLDGYTYLESSPPR